MFAERRPKLFAFLVAILEETGFLLENVGKKRAPDFAHISLSNQNGLDEVEGFHHYESEGWEIRFGRESACKFRYA